MSFNSVLSSDKLFKKTVKKNGQYLTDFLVDCIIGGVSAAISKTAVAPIERIKLLMQYQDEMIKTGRLDRPYTNIVDCFSRIIREQGASALWKGNLIRVIHYYPTQAFNFALKDFFRQLFCMDEKRDDNLKWFLGNLASGGAAGAVSSTLVYSLDYARTRFVNDRIRYVTKNGFIRKHLVSKILTEIHLGRNRFLGFIYRWF
jgi:solute carrier family 25 (adenine nucleotide translocator) protein 4/5/6/31